MELWDLYDRDRNLLPGTMERGAPRPEGTYHLVVHACIFNEAGELLIQQRQPFKEGWPNLWDVTVGGSSVAGEDSRAAVTREVLEELGLQIDFSDSRPAFTINYDTGFDDFYLLKKEVDLSALHLQYEEVQAVKWAGLEEVLAMIDGGAFIPYDKSFIAFLFSQGKRRGIHVSQG